jgi:hypothetical protein
MTDAELDRVKHDGALLRSIISRTVKLTKDGNGGRLKGHCPFHSEKDESFKVFADGWKCFGCNRGGSVFDYVMQRDGIDFAAAVRCIEAEGGLSSAPPKGKKSGNGTHHGGNIWQPIVPVPADAPLPDDHLLDDCSVFPYRGPDGGLLFYQRRFDKPDGGKMFAQLTYGTLRAVTGWHAKGPPQPYPLYRLELLTNADPQTPVLVVEGEGKCQAAERMFPRYIVTAWLNGANSVHLTDWDPLKRFETVVWWPDADKPKADGRPHGCFLATPAFRKLFPHAKSVDTAGLDDIIDGFDAADLEALPGIDREAWLKERLREPPPQLADEIAASAWLKRTTMAVDRLLGDVITTTTRAFIVGRTGIGKTLLGIAFAVAMALGIGFLHWRSNRPARVLYFDGEMPAELLIQRLRDEAQRRQQEGNPLLANLMVFSLEDAEAIAERWPMIGMFQPLNTEEGHEFIKRLCDALKPDVIIFDNVQSLLVGVQKEEETWIGTLPIVQWLTAKRIGQAWLDHTGHNAIHQYGTAVKAWRFDVVGLILPLGEDERDPRETAFTLSFDHPGKARRRTPANWNEFTATMIRLRDGQWTGEPADGEAATRKRLHRKVGPKTRKFHDALIDAIAAAATGPGETAMFAWEIECVRMGLLDPFAADDHWQVRHSKRTKFRNAKIDLVAAEMIGIDGQRVMDRTRSWT